MAAALTGWSALAPYGIALLAATVLDLAIGDPSYRWHPVRLIGQALVWFERRLRAIGADAYGGGIALFVLLSVTSIGLVSTLVVLGASVDPWLGFAVHVFFVYSFLALGDLLRHVWRIEVAVRSGDLERARAAVAALVGRDTEHLDGAACRRAGVESLSESLTDGFTSAVFWYVLLGLPGLVLFKVVSTMDSMVGYKTPQYLRFGWCGARADDVMNYVPARLTWLLIATLAFVLPRYSGRKALAVGWRQHAILPGPNSGWSEAAAAGAVERRIVGPIWRGGTLVTDVWIGDPSDPPFATASDTVRSMMLVTLAGVCAAGLGSVLCRV